MKPLPGSPDWDVVSALYSNKLDDSPLIPDVPLVPDVPEVPASVLVSNLLVVVLYTTTWSEVLPDGTSNTLSPLRTTNSLFPAMIFFFHFPKEKFFYVY